MTRLTIRVSIPGGTIQSLIYVSYLSVGGGFNSWWYNSEHERPFVSTFYCISFNSWWYNSEQDLMRKLYHLKCCFNSWWYNSETLSSVIKIFPDRFQFLVVQFRVFCRNISHDLLECFNSWWYNSEPDFFTVLNYYYSDSCDI